MISDDYYALATATSSEVNTVIRRYVDGLAPTTAHLPLRRMERHRLRDLSCRLGYELCGGKEWQVMVPAAAAFELLNSASYVINWIFDEKGGQKSRQQVNDLILAGFELREASQRALQDHGRQDLSPAISDITAKCCEGEHLDLKELKLDRLGQYTSLDGFLRDYDRRCVLISGVFHGHCLSAGSTVLGSHNEHLYAIGEAFGSTLQASNDLGDFALPRSDVATMDKPYSDQFSDLRQGKLTLPVYMLLSQMRDGDRCFVESCVGRDLNVTDCERLVRLLHETKTFEYCFGRLKERQKAAKKHLYAEFARSQQRDFVGQMLATIVTNKFLYGLRSSAGGKQSLSPCSR